MTTNMGNKIMFARREINMRQEELANKMGVSRTTIVNWESNKFAPTQDNLERLSGVLKKPVSYFFEIDKSDVDLSSFKPLTSDNTVTLPLLASIPAGLPDYSNADIESFTNIPRYLFPGADFIIHCCGDSMEPEIGKGSYCVIRKETIPLNNAIMLVKTEDGFTIKRIIIKGKTIELHPSNGDHKIIRPKELKIIGEVIGTWNRISRT
jgi:repressor LexA